MSDSTVFDSTSVPPQGHGLPGFDSFPRPARAAVSLGACSNVSRRLRLWPVLLAAALAACSDRRIVFCDPAVPYAAGGCPTAGAGGGGGSGGGAAGNSAIAGSSGAAGVGGSGGLAGAGGSAGSSGGAPPGGGSGGAGSDVDASAPLPDAGVDAGAVLDAATP